MISIYLIGLFTVGAILWLAIYIRNEKHGIADFGKVTLHLCGALNGTHSGQARFDVLEVSNTKVWVISMRNDWSKAFSFQLSLSSLGGDYLTQPVPGSYAIASGSYGSTSAFSASYSHIVNSNQLHVDAYNTLNKGGGVLIIEAADDSEVSGSFIFIAHRHDSSLASLSVIEVSGKFTAPKAV